MSDDIDALLESDVALDLVHAFLEESPLEPPEEEVDGAVMRLQARLGRRSSGSAVFLAAAVTLFGLLTLQTVSVQTPHQPVHVEAFAPTEAVVRVPEGVVPVREVVVPDVKPSMPRTDPRPAPSPTDPWARDAESLERIRERMQRVDPHTLDRLRRRLESR